MKTNEATKQPRPSYEEGAVRDPKIAAMQGKGTDREKFLALVRKAVQPLSATGMKQGKSQP